MVEINPASPNESIVHGACRPGHGGRDPNGTVSEWIETVQNAGIQRVCCLLDETLLQEYDDLIGEYKAVFGEQNVCHTPIPDFRVVDTDVWTDQILPFLQASDTNNEPVIVHCSAGIGRTGHILALWLATERNYGLSDAIRAVRKTGHRPLEGPKTQRDLKAILTES